MNATAATDDGHEGSALRRGLIVVGVLLLVLLLAAALLITTFDAKRFQVLAVDWMRDTHQRTLVIDGPVTLSVFPRLSVKVAKLRLSEQASAEPFLAVDEAELSVRVLPLLSKQLVVDRVSARGVQATLRRDEKGVRNVDDLIAAENPANPVAVPEASASAATGSALAFDVSAVRLQDVRLDVQDRMTPLVGRLLLQSFESGRLAPGLVTPVTLKAALELQQPRVATLQFDGSGNLSLDLRKNAVSMGGMLLSVSGDAVGLTRLQAKLDGDLAWDGRAVQAGPLRMAVQSAQRGETTLQASTVAVGRALYSPGAQRIELQDLKLALAGQQGTSPFGLDVDWPKLLVEGQRIEGSALSGHARSSGAQMLDASFSTAAPRGTFDALVLPGLTLKLKAGLGSRQVDGHLAGNLQLDTGGKAPAGATIDQLVLTAAVTEPGLAPLQLSLQGRVQGGVKSAAWKLDGALNSNRFDTAGTADVTGQRPRVDVDGRFDRLDLDTLLRPVPATRATSTAPAEPAAIEWAVLRQIDGRFDLSSRSLVFGRYRVADARLQAALDSGRLQVTRLTGQAWGGSLQASGSADASGNRVALKAEATGVDIGALLKTVADKDLLSGNGRFSADLHSSGTSLAAMRSALAGSAALQVRDGAVKGFNIAQSLRQAKAALAGRVDTAVGAVPTEQTDFSEMTVSARIDRGVASSDDLDLKSPFLRIGGDGRVDIARATVDYTARATVIGSSKGQGGAELDALRGVTVPVRLTGPIDAIGWRVVWSEVAARAIEQQLKDRVKDKLGELLGDRAGDARRSAPGAAAGLAGSAAPAGAPKRPEDRLKDELREGLRGLFK